MQLKQRAEIVRRRLSAGYWTLSEAVAWADGIVEAEIQPPIQVIEVSLASRRGVDDAIAQLQSFTDGIAADDLLRETVANMQAILQSDPTRARAIAQTLHGMALQGIFPSQADLPELYTVAYAFDPEEATWAPSGAEALAYLFEVLDKLHRALSPAL